MINATLYGLAWAGIIMLFHFATWEGNCLHKYILWLESKKSKLINIFGACLVCTGFWWGVPYLYCDPMHYFIFVGVSEMILVFYVLLLNFLEEK